MSDERNEVITLNGHPIADTKVRGRVDKLTEEIGAVINDTMVVAGENYKDVPEAEKTVVSGYYLEPTTVRTYKTQGSGWQYIKLPVNAGETYYIKSKAGLGARQYLFFGSDDETQLALGYAEYNGSITDREEYVTVPAGAVMMCVNNNVPENYGYAAIIKRGEKQYKVDMDKLPLSPYIKANRLWGKTLVTCGDSITYGADMDAAGILPDGTLMTYGWQIADRNNMVFVKDGVAGSCMQGSGLSNGRTDGFSAEGGRYTKLPENIDYLVIFFGHNDEVYGETGAIGDATNATFYGAYNIVMDYLIRKYPYAKICLVCPFGAYNKRVAVRAIAKKWGVGCFDMDGEGTPMFIDKDHAVDRGIEAFRQSIYLANGIHPNYEGHKHIADRLENYLRSL